MAKKRAKKKAKSAKPPQAGRRANGKFAVGNTLSPWKPGTSGNPTGMAGRRFIDHIRRMADEQVPPAKKGGRPTGITWGEAFATHIFELALTKPDEGKDASLHVAAMRFLASRMWPIEQTDGGVTINVTVLSEQGRKMVDRLITAGGGQLAGREAVIESLRQVRLADVEAADG